MLPFAGLKPNLDIFGIEAACVPVTVNVLGLAMQSYSAPEYDFNDRGTADFRSQIEIIEAIASCGRQAPRAITQGGEICFTKQRYGAAIARPGRFAWPASCWLSRCRDSVWRRRTTAADPAPIEEITVTGFRSSLVSAISNKRDSDSVVESVTAEDLGKLPDISIAESLARLPGVTAQRTGGQASALNIRGLDQGLILTTLNGREQVATSGGRAIEFSQYPSELISGADVYKSPEARLIEGGLAGTSPSGWPDL